MSETQDRMLDTINDSYDKSEGSFFYDVIKPVSIELDEQNKNIESTFNKVFVDTAVGVYLDKRVIEQGLSRKQATKADGCVIITGQEGVVINQGIKVASDSMTYTVIEAKTIDVSTKATVQIVADIAGSIGNCPVGAIKYFPITIQGLNGVTNEGSVTSGYDGETDDELRQRYYDKVKTPSTSGNVYHYLNWAKEVTGVGAARVFPLWNGNGTVKVVIISSNGTGADGQLVTDTINHIEDNRPIGATVSVVSAIEKVIDVSADLNIDEVNYTLEQVRTSIEITITNYLKEIAFKETYVSYARIGGLILDSGGVTDYSNLKVNLGTANVLIGTEEVAVMGVIL